MDKKDEEHNSQNMKAKDVLRKNVKKGTFDSISGGEKIREDLEKDVLEDIEVCRKIKALEEEGNKKLKVIMEEMDEITKRTTRIHILVWSFILVFFVLIVTLLFGLFIGWWLYEWDIDSSCFNSSNPVLFSWKHIYISKDLWYFWYKQQAQTDKIDLYPQLLLFSTYIFGDL